MSRYLEKQAYVLLERIANASGRTVDTAYASLVHKLGLTQPFFKVIAHSLPYVYSSSAERQKRSQIRLEHYLQAVCDGIWTHQVMEDIASRCAQEIDLLPSINLQAGWGNLQAVDFQSDAELLYNWPPAHFDVKARST